MLVWEKQCPRQAHAPGGTSRGVSLVTEAGSIDWWPTTPGAMPAITPAQASAAASKGAGRYPSPLPCWLRPGG